MKTILIVILFITISISAQDFREFKWGDSKSKVKKLEVEGELLDFPCPWGNDGLVYKDVVVGSLKWTMAYIFIKGKLASGFYMISNPTEDEYNIIEELLYSKYGEQESGDYWITKHTSIRLVFTASVLTITYRDIKKEKELNALYKNAITKGL